MLKHKMSLAIGAGVGLAVSVLSSVVFFGVTFFVLLYFSPLTNLPGCPD